MVLFCALLLSERKINPGTRWRVDSLCHSALVKGLKGEASGIFSPVEGRGRIKVPSSSGNSESQLTSSLIKGGGCSLIKGGPHCPDISCLASPEGSLPVGFQGLLPLLGLDDLFVLSSRPESSERQCVTGSAEEAA